MIAVNLDHYKSVETNNTIYCVKDTEKRIISVTIRRAVDYSSDNKPMELIRRILSIPTAIVMSPMITHKVRAIDAG